MRLFFSWVLASSMALVGAAQNTWSEEPSRSGEPVGADDWCRRATVRLRADAADGKSSVGSGTVFHRDANACYVLTNAHVAGRRIGATVAVELWNAGHQSRPVEGRMVLASYVPGGERDVAVVRIANENLGAYRPPVVPLAADDCPIAGGRVWSIGCGGGRWPTAFEGFVRRLGQASRTVQFVPMPAGGRSGSALFDWSGGHPRIVGLIAWRSTPDGGHSLDGRDETHGHGIAMTHREVWRALRGQPSTGEAPAVYHVEPSAGVFERDRGSGANRGCPEKFSGNPPGSCPGKLPGICPGKCPHGLSNGEPAGRLFPSLPAGPNGDASPLPWGLDHEGGGRRIRPLGGLRKALSDRFWTRAIEEVWPALVGVLVALHLLQRRLTGLADRLGGWLQSLQPPRRKSRATTPRRRSTKGAKR